MARKQRITRDVTSTEVEIMLCDTSSGVIRSEYDIIVGKTTKKKAEKKAKKRYEKENLVVVKVTLTEKHDKYSMDLETFVRFGEIVGAETVSPAETENE